MHRTRFILASLLVATGCSSPKAETKHDDQAVESNAQNDPSKAPDLSESKCLGNRVPPTNYEQATAFVPAGDPNATEQASREAVRKLRDRICQGYRCDELEPKIKLWNTQKDSLQVCAMAVVKNSDITAFKDAPRMKLENALDARAKQLLGNFRRNEEPRIAIDNVRDSGVDGGPRAEWLIGRMNAALSKEGALLVRIPSNWSGLGLPKGADGVLRGRITPMNGQEAMLEVTWNLDLGRGMKTADPIAFPELIGPSINPLSTMPDLAGVNRSISLRFDSRPGGALCEGQKTELRLETDQALNVRVIDLFGNGDKGLIINAPPDAIPGHSPRSLGDFQVVKDGKVPVERFLVIGGIAESDLGLFAKVKAPCRLPRDVARQLSKGRGIPPQAREFVTSRSYRIISGEACSSYVPRKMPVGWFEKIPLCF